MKRLGDLMSPNDPELVEKTLARIAEQDTWNDLFSTKLIDLLDNIDLLKGEVRGQMRTVESVAKTGFTSLQRAETAHVQASESALAAKRLLDQSTCQLDHARDCTVEANQWLNAAGDRLTSSEKNLKKACELEAAAEKKQINASRILRTATRRSALAIAASWIATIWTAWFALRSAVPLWAVSATTVVLVVAAVLFKKTTTNEA